ncbi:LLM class flavin-dependent oxidoreductase [Phytoactinopolyspora halotolerans]|uniref:LLM class flavin-dependent oxidoreductase n=1 Tax=Phytoactinopolyspora halotolerans TaxID=1981512 RepID=A0A6L9S8W4_9ACTN|nr:LLM class flavin-dependent oxidoreductase [Phytoactinopolyspora halotolerans]NEE01044.1 LLM class flavin-dependent oxidoreductase [Phytoactinopolyspora halotolerans]
MTDYGHDLLFGTFVTPAAAQAGRVVELAQLTDDVGLDIFTAQDHPYQSAFLDTWTLLSVVAAKTSRVRVMPNVVSLPLRPPAVLAKSAASLDILSGGRVELGLGAGPFLEPIAAMGGPARTVGENIDALQEGIEIIRAMWRPEAGAVRVDGKHYRVWGAKPGPAPAHEIGIWLGAVKKRMLGITGRLADGWSVSSPYAAPESLPAMNTLIDEAAQSAGRDPAAIRRLYNLMGSFSGSGSEFLQGPPATWAEQLAELAVTEGMSVFILAADDPTTIRRYAAEVVPAVRELVEQERAGGPVSAVREAAAAPSRPEIAGVGDSVPAGLGVTPTPDDGTRLSSERVWNEDDRPSGPVPDPEQTYTAQQRASGQHLIDVHDHLRAELAEIRGLIDQVAAGTIDAGQARSHINTMTMRQNNWTLGTYCESYCRVVTTHHTLEDQTMLPYLRRADGRLAPVVDRLQEEHLAIHDVLERVDAALVGLVSGEHGIDGLRRAVDLLTDTLLSHLSYEERELVEPLARLGFQ